MIVCKAHFFSTIILNARRYNPPPNFSCQYLTHSIEQIIWARKSEKFKHIFNYELMKELKPLPLLVRLILMASNKNSVVCDPFAGSSTTGIAANLLGRKFVGIEKEDEFINIAMKRKSELDANFDLFKRRILDINKLD